MRLQLLNVPGNLTAISEIWLELSAGRTHSYFQSWAWMEHWLASLPENVLPRLAVVRGDREEALAAFFLAYDTVVNRNVFRSCAYVLNQTGKWEFDRLYIEHNLILRKEGCAISLREILAMLPEAWEEVYLSALSKDEFPGNDLTELPAGCELVLVKELPCPYVDLEKVRQKAGDYLAVLGSSVRSQIKRTYKLYAEQGEISCESAATLDQALAIYHELIELHEASWRKRDQPGAFATEYFRTFHQTLIEKRFACGEIQLLRVKAGERTIGCLYNFVFGGRVHFYQSGLVVETDNRLKPGYLAHAEAVKLSANLGLAVYDFLAGPEEYKQRMSTDQTSLVWVRLQKPRIKFKIEQMMRTAAIAGQARYLDWKRSRASKTPVGQG